MYIPEEVGRGRINDAEETIDLNKVFSKLTDKWYWFLFGAVLGLLLALLYSVYTQPVYKVSARVLMNDQQKSGGLSKQAGALMDLGGIMGSPSSVDNEAEVLKTPDLIEKVVRRLNLNVVYSYEANLIKREIYDSPIQLNLIVEADTIKSTILKVNKVNENRIHVRTKDFDKEVSYAEVFVIKGVGSVQFKRNSSVKMTEGNYLVNISSVDKRVTDLSKELSVEVSNSEVTIVDLSLNYPLQKRGEEILNTLINAYKASNLEDKNAIADSTYNFITARLNVIASELGDVEDEVSTFKQKNRLADMTEQGKLLVQNTSEFATELAQVETQISVLNDLEAYLEDETRNKRVFPTSLLPSDLIFSALMEQYNGLLSERDRTLMSVTEATPFVQNLNNQITTLRRGILSNLQNTKNTYVLTRKKLQSQLNEAQEKIEGVPQIEKNFLKLARNQQIKQELYIFLMQKAEETAISKTSNISIAKVIARPKAGVLPVSPRTNVVFVLGLFGGIFFPFIIVIIRDLFDTKIRSKEDITSATHLPLVGEISHNQTNDNLIVSHSGRSPIAEQFRALRSNLSFYLKNNGHSVILLTSSMSGEGKSFTSINLANVLGLLGKKVLLMEMDLRKPGLSNKLNIKNDVGLSNYVVDDHLKPSDIIRPLDLNKNVFLVPSGLIPPNPVELLMHERTAELIETLKNEFDYIIMDAPPIGIVTDAESLVEYADITLYLVRHHVTKRQQLQIPDQLYKTGKIKKIGLIVNDVDSKYYGAGYGSGYGTYGQEQESSIFQKVLEKFKL